MTSVLVTGSRDGASRLVGALEEAGFDVVACPLIGIQPVGGPIADARRFDWMVFTSRAGVQYGLPRLTGSARRVAAVGPGTAAALRDAGVSVDLVPPEHSQRGLIEALGSSPGSVLFPGAERAGRALVDAFGAHHLVVYRTVELSPPRVPDADLAVLASGSAARSLARQRTDIPCVTIGPSTSAQAASSGLRVVHEAASSDLAGLVDAVRVGASRLQ